MRRLSHLAPLLALALLGEAAPLSAQEARPAAQTARTIRVSATGETRARPDEAHVEFGVETTATTARAASEQNARLMEAIVRALVAAGVPRAGIETRNFSVMPEYARPAIPESEPRIRGYRVSNVVSARADDVARVGALIDAALAAGANRVHGVRFGFRDPETLRAQALRNAVERGRAEAQTIAAALGVTLGSVLDASTSVEPFRPYIVATGDFAARGVEMAAPATPVEPGEQSVRALVTLVFGIVGR